MKLNTLLFLSLFLLFACNKDDDTNPGIPSNTITAEINGQTFTADAQSQINNIFVQFFSIAGAVDLGNGEFETLVLLLDFPIGETLSENSYEYNGSVCIPTNEICGSIAYGVREPDEEVAFSSVSEDNNGNSKMTFTDLDYRPNGHAIGTFSGILYNESGDEIRITNGKFNVDISE